MQYTVVHALQRLILCAALAACAAIASARDADLYLAGVGLHQETGRDIYLGGILLDSLTMRPDDLVSAPGPKVMEYRVVARRTSIRSLLGSMLLQGEVANGQPPGATTRAFANAILSTVQGSLYAGDALQIRLNANDTTTASLNGHEIARADGREASNYLLAGWVDESGPNTAFRSSLLADRPAADLASRWDETLPDDKRIAEVSAWSDSQVAATETTAEARPRTTSTTQEFAVDETAFSAPDATNTVSSSPQEQAAASSVVTATDPDTGTGLTADMLVPVSAASVAIRTTPENRDLLEVPQPTEQSLESPRDSHEQIPNPLDQGTQVATLLATPDILAPQLPQGVAELSVELYSQRLYAFNSNLLRKIYSQINYPARAVRRSIQGSLELDLLLGRDGSFIDVSVVRSSGHSLLDKAALAAARKALASGVQSALDPVAIAEYSNTQDQLVVPVPVSFVLTE
tara:strand:+ start:87944 stop:89326 length:1383 start_codon:yes stop_codon:yes gene_type:complete